MAFIIIPARYILDPNGDNVAAVKLVVIRQIKHRKVAGQGSATLAAQLSDLSIH
jgi:hypothetical protein